MDILKKFFMRVPEEYRREFFEEVNRQNLFRVIVTALVLIAVEMVAVLFFRKEFFNTLPAVYGIIIVSLIFFPVMCVLYRKEKAERAAHVVSMTYICLVLVFLSVLAIAPQDQFASINTYVIGLFGFAAFIYVHPVGSFILYLALYIGFFFTLPIFQHNDQFVGILRFNAFCTNMIAFVFSRLVYRMKVLAFIDKKVIQHKNSILKDMISKDPMTSLLNHEAAFSMLQEEINQAKRTKYPVSIIMTDIDDFKPVNDKFGHQIGDEVIVSIAGVITGACRKTDVVCRYGGDEYMLILPDTSLKEAALLAGRILARVENTELVNGIYLTLSAGVCESGGESAKELIYRADKQLYRAKHGGKNRISFSG